MILDKNVRCPYEKYNKNLPYFPPQPILELKDRWTKSIWIF